MSTAVQALDLESFLAWETAQEVKHVFDGTATIAMAGGTAAHALIQGNLAIAIGSRLRGKPRFYGSDLKIAVAGSIPYPDGIVVCTPVAPNAHIVTDPNVIFEVLSESTARTDVGAKNREYEATASVQRDVILEQDAIAGLQFERSGGDWIGHILHPDSCLRMPETGIEVMLSERYEGLDRKNLATGSHSV